MGRMGTSCLRMGQWRILFTSYSLGAAASCIVHVTLIWYRPKSVFLIRFAQSADSACGGGCHIPQHRN